MERLSRMEKYAELRKRLEEKEPENVAVENSSEDIDEINKSNNNLSEDGNAELPTPNENVDNISEIDETSDNLKNVIGEDTFDKPLDFNFSISNKESTSLTQNSSVDFLNSPLNADEIVKETNTNEIDTNHIEIADLMNSLSALVENVNEEEKKSVVSEQEKEIVAEDNLSKDEEKEDLELIFEPTIEEIQEEENHELVEEVVEETLEEDISSLEAEENNDSQINILENKDDNAKPLADEEKENGEANVSFSQEEEKESDETVVTNNISTIEEEVSSDTAMAESVENTSEKIAEENYLEKTLKEVNEYNKAKGLVTADQITPTILNEIRSSVNEEENLTHEVDTLSEQEQQDINDTVTLEIQNILKAIEEDEKTKTEGSKDEISNEEQSYIDMWEKSSDALDSETESLMSGGGESNSNLITPITIENKENDDKTIKNETITSEEKLGDTKVMEALEKTKEDSAVQEIKDQTLELSANSLLNETKPYVINQEIKEDDKEENSNKALNIILIILVIALAVILGITVYGLLKTMNII